jgi:ribose transport system ATP-binding protein
MQASLDSGSVPASSPDILLRVTRLGKRFGGTHALQDVSFDVRAGEIHALLGENGAGKSTLIKILAGIHQPDAGAIHGPEGPQPPGHAVPGVAFVHQDLGLVPTASVAENIAIGIGFSRRWGLIDWARSVRRAAAALDVMGCAIDPAGLVGRLTAAEKSMVAIARALAINARVLVLDEPSATLPEADVVKLHEVLARLKAQGLGIIYVTHRLDEVFRFADRATVLRDGQVRATLATRATTPRELMRHILGRDMEALFAARARRMGDIRLAVTELRSVHVGPCSFAVRSGEILALVGLRGAGHDVVGRMLAGDIAPRTGRIALDGVDLLLADPGDAIAAGIGFVSSKRVEESLCMGLSLRENLYINPLTAGFDTVGTVRERASAAKALSLHDVRPPHPERLIALLSGGNQQKVVLARFLSIGRKVLILEEPTIGVDVGAKADIYRLLERALEGGLSVILVSSDFEEVAGLSDRILLFDRGRQRAELPAAGVSAAHLTALATGALQ